MDLFHGYGAEVVLELVVFWVIAFQLCLEVVIGLVEVEELGADVEYCGVGFFQAFLEFFLPLFIVVGEIYTQVVFFLEEGVWDTGVVESVGLL